MFIASYYRQLSADIEWKIIRLKKSNFDIPRKFSEFDAIHAFSIWLRTGSNPVKSNRLRSHTGKRIIWVRIRVWFLKQTCTKRLEYYTGKLKDHHLIKRCFLLRLNSMDIINNRFNSLFLVYIEYFCIINNHFCVRSYSTTMFICSLYSN